MGHQQLKNQVVTYNSTAEGLVNETMTPNRSKTYDFRTNWVKCTETQHQFNIIRKRKKITEQTTTQKITLHVYTRKKEVKTYIYAPKS